MSFLRQSADTFENYIKNELDARQKDSESRSKTRNSVESRPPPTNPFMGIDEKMAEFWPHLEPPPTNSSSHFRHFWGVPL